jgi:hypothetical protein
MKKKKKKFTSRNKKRNKGWATRKYKPNNISKRMQASEDTSHLVRGTDTKNRGQQ